RARGDERREHLRSGTEPVVVEVVLGDPHGRIAEGFGGEHLSEAPVVDALLAPRLVALHEKEEPELHSRPPVAATELAAIRCGRGDSPECTTPGACRCSYRC